MKTYEKKFRISKDNKGSALIVCIIVLLFVSILATVILYTSGINYRMKASDYRTRVSFYSAEAPLETIQGNLVVPVSEALDIAYRRTNTQFEVLGTPDARREYFYKQFEKEFKRIMIQEYGGPSIGTSGDSYTDSTFVKNILHNLSYTNGDADNGVLVENIICNDIYTANDGIPYIDYTADPMRFIKELDDKDKLDGSVGTDTVYLVVPDSLNSGPDAEHPTPVDANYANFVELSCGDLDAHVLNDPSECRLLLKNICVVFVHSNGYRSIITTDIAIQFPDIAWERPALSVSGNEYRSFDVYQLIYYVNWKKN